MSASIALYGTHATGAGWLASLGEKLLGDGDPVAGRSFTEAVWIAADALEWAGYSGPAWVYAPGGERKAKIRIGRHVPAYGDLKWEAAEAYVIPLEKWLEAAETDLDELAEYEDYHLEV